MVRHEMVRHAGHKMRGDVATDPRRLERVVVDIAMVRVGIGIVAGDCNVDGRENCDGMIADAPGKMAVAAVARFVVTGIDHIRPEPEPREVKAYVSTQRGVAISAIAAKAGHLKYELNELHVVRLIGMDTGIGSRHGDIDRVEQRVSCVDDASVKETISAVTGLVSPT